MMPSFQAGKHITGDETVLSVKGMLCYQFFLSGYFMARNKKSINSKTTECCLTCCEFIGKQYSVESN
jgi:hypothetical protein